MNIAIVGCGFVSWLYFKSLSRHPQLKLKGVYDLNADRGQAFAVKASVHLYPTYAEVLSDPTVDCIVNLTNPAAHYSVIELALQANKHVYSEKPLTMDFQQAKHLATLATEKGLQLCSAPTTLLHETAQTLWKAIDSNLIGKPKLIFAELHDGYFASKRFHHWKSELGVPWPYEDEFEVGCTIEHVAYYTTWLTAIFGPARTVFATDALLTPEKGPNGQHDASDYSAAVLNFDHGIVAQFSTSIVAPPDRSLRVFGEKGTLEVDDAWHHQSGVYLRKRMNIRNRLIELPFRRKVPFVFKTPRVPRYGDLYIDFALGINDLAEAIKEKRKARLNAQFSLHNLELTLAMAGHLSPGKIHQVETSFEPVRPMFAIEEPA